MATPSSSPKLRMRKLLLKDEVFIKYKRILKHVNSIAEYTNNVKELETMHLGRVSRTLWLSEPSAEKLIEASMQDSAYRSRCVEIMIGLSKATRLLDAGIVTMVDHIIATYSSSMSTIRTKGEREQLIRNLLASGYTKLADLERMTEIAEQVVGDIDKTSFALKHALEGMALLYAREK